jgi:hypothetical protein
VALPADFPSTSPSNPLGDGDLSSAATGQRTQRKLPLITVEAVLEWPVFDDRDINRKVHLLSPPEENIHQPGLPISVDVDFHEADGLLRKFFDDVHIFNPTLEEEDVREYVNIVRLNGIGWDAMSCLLVTTPFPFGRARLTRNSF